MAAPVGQWWGDRRRMSTVQLIARRLPLLLVPLVVLALGGEARAGEHVVVYEQATGDPLGLSVQIAPGLAGCTVGCATLRIPARTAVPARRQAVLQFAAPAGTTIVQAQVRLRLRTRQAGVVTKVQARVGGRWIDQVRLRSAQTATRTVAAGAGASAVAVALLAETAIGRGAVRSDAENAVTVESVSLRVRDASPPQVRWDDDPASGAWQRGVVCAGLSAGDVGLGIDRLEYAIGGAVASVAAAPGSRLQPRPLELVARPCVDTTQLPDGSYGTAAAAVDGTGDGNRSTVAGGVMRIDNTAPAVQFSGPADPEARLPELRLGLHDAASGIERVQVTVDGLPITVRLDRGEVRFQPPQPLQDGLHLIAWQVADAAGNRTDGQEVIAVRDGTAPTIDDVGPAGQTTADAQLRARVLDTGAGVAPDGVRIAVDGLDMTAVATFADGYLRLRHPLGWAPGEHAVQVVAHDRSGNRAQASWAFSVPPPPPAPAPAPAAPSEVPVAGPAAAPDAPESDGARLQAPARLRIAGARGTLAVRVSVGGTPAAGVAVLALDMGGRRVAAAVTGPDGAASLGIRRGHGDGVRVVALDAEVQVAVDEEPLLRLRAGTRRVPAGASVRLTGSAPAGARVSIEARVRGRWTPVVRVSADAEGAFGTPVRLPAPGVYTVRARTGRALSPPVRLTAR